MSGNQLKHEKSLYLLQHANNPIWWQSFKPQVLEIARKEKKLIYLSLGYSSCHWCHVMERESFQNDQVAQYLNENYVSIKMDREEFPDFDQYFQNVAQLTGRQGGWPLNVIMTPEAEVFFVTTYLPQAQFLKMLTDLHSQFATEENEIRKTATDIKKILSQKPTLEKKIEFPGHFPAPSSILNAMEPYRDKIFGGYGEAPKFPHFAFYEWAVEQILEGMVPEELGKPIVETIEKMLLGGLYDHVKGGVHRYSTDKEFRVPHFEKMLYDQAGLLKLLAKLGQLFPAPVVFDSILQTLDYLKTEMLSESGYFFSAQDADSEGEEGLYFTFTKDEFEETFKDAPDEQRIKLDFYLDVFGISEKGQLKNGMNVISLQAKYKDQIYSEEGWQAIRDIRRRLLEERKLRLPPATDHKGIASWNYHLLSSLTDLVQYCPIPFIQNQALEILDPLVEKMLQTFIVANEKHTLKHSTTIHHTYQYLEDYAAFADAQLRLYEITGNETFKKNTSECLKFMVHEFIQEGELRLTNQKDSIHASYFDQSFRSPAMSFVLTLSRFSVFDPQFSPEKVFKNFGDFSQLCLTNPLAHGEGLRALSYPQEIFRKITVPRSWLTKKEFLELRSHLFARFVMDYHGEENQRYEICHRSGCELSGEEFDQFQKIFQAKE